MEPQIFFNVAVGLAGFFGGWALTRIYHAIDQLDGDVRKMPLVYVTKDDYRSDIGDIKNMLGKIVDRLEGKADK